MGLPSPRPDGSPGKHVGSLPRRWTLSRVPGLLLLAQMLLPLGAPRQDVLFLPQCLAWPPPALPPQSCWRRGAATARLFVYLLDKRHSGSGRLALQVLPTREWRSTGVEWDLGQALAELASPGCGAEGAGGEVQGPAHPQPCPCTLHPHGNTPGAGYSWDPGSCAHPVVSFQI